MKIDMEWRSDWTTSFDFVRFAHLRRLICET